MLRFVGTIYFCLNGVYVVTDLKIVNPESYLAEENTENTAELNI